MTESTISLISILCGILGANFMGFILKKTSLGLVGNSITGVFGSIFFIKLIGRLGFDPISIMHSGNLNGKLFFLNILVSFAGGVIALILAKEVKNKMNKA